MLEHVNITVKDPQKTAKLLQQVFDWKVRWQGPAINEGYTIHVGDDISYIALYQEPEGSSYLKHEQRRNGGFNHLGIVVNDLDAVEKKVNQAGYQAHSHYDYEPGKRFYFYDEDGVEYEVVSYKD